MNVRFVASIVIITGSPAFASAATSNATTFSAIAANGYRSCAIARSGDVFCWGGNGRSGIGDGTSLDQNKPREISGARGAISLSLGMGRTCALMPDRSLKCWGNVGGQKPEVPTDIPNVSSNIAEVAVTQEQTYVRTDEGQILCAERCSESQIDEWSLPRANQIAAAGFGACAATNDERLFCWGSWTVGGELPAAESELYTLPTQIGDNVTGIGAGYFHGCAIMTTGIPACWGYNYAGALGDSTYFNRRNPTDIKFRGRAVQVSGGFHHSCALTDDGEIICWGFNSAGQLGRRTTTVFDNPPEPIVGLPNNISSVAIGLSHSCALTKSGKAYCWGGNWAGQLGNGTFENSYVPIEVILP